jgi:hypothetical protein
MKRFLTITEVARHFRSRRPDLEMNHVRRTIERGFFPEPGRCGLHRLFLAEDLPALEKALEAAGYLPPVTEPEEGEPDAAGEKPRRKREPASA